MMRLSKMLTLFGSVIIGIGIATGVQLATGQVDVILIQSEYKDAMEYSGRLKNEINALKKTEEKILTKLHEYEKESTDSFHVMEDLTEEYSRNEKLLGYKDVRGAGLIISLEDGIPKEGEQEGSIDSWLRIIHNEDMLKLINELKLNGAEAISINGQRVTETSEVYCSWAFISINGQKLPSPFVVKAIGDKGLLEAYTETEFNQLRIMKNRGIQVNLEKMPIIVLEGSVPPIIPKYLQEAE
ncbi:DUF881 domain-containing protein [Proteiniclasticum sp. C24MP]|uniref:DUF881 domain-containing protein n=1 Tax=Proteiniclasticum sp. C24MP TaxID=3374101 RepID=UPI0037550B3C